LKRNLNQVVLVREISDFIARLRGKPNGEGFFWFAGHGMMIEGVNYLLPTNVNIETDDIIKATSYSLSMLIDQLNQLHNKANVVVLDACRSPPKTIIRGGDETTRIVQRISDVPPDLFIMYSTAYGKPALEGDGKRNSPFIEAFLKHIMSTEPLSLMASDVISETRSITGGRQIPDYQGSIISEKYYSLNSAGSLPRNQSAQSPLPPKSPGKSLLTARSWA